MRRMVKNGEKGGYRDGKNVNEKRNIPYLPYVLNPIPDQWLASRYNWCSKYLVKIK